jgi:hypothetical protein
LMDTCKIMIANHDDHIAVRRVNLLAEDGYNLLKLAVKAGALQ